MRNGASDCIGIDGTKAIRQGLENVKMSRQSADEAFVVRKTLTRPSTAHF
ncbi:hypothetical protein SAMN04487967_3642 [Natronorubrum sediminis]|uniref:Uncharacterized protein n=1 Tax=Natronorubrum sediminis TaxID=640943 RepID=A0A1H6G701_9EURY|nr:hypothetical protein SAMN04487967_3642 [Natronorubrum sediminis]